MSEPRELIEVMADAIGVPERAEAGYRAGHTLKGLGAGVAGVAEVARALEVAFDAQRRGEAEVAPEALTAGVAWLRRAIDGELVPYREVLDALAVDVPISVERTMQLPHEIEAVLTDLEVVRVERAVRVGHPLCMGRVVLALLTCDRELAAVRARVAAAGQLIACLPARTVTRPEALELDLLMAGPPAELALALGADVEVVTPEPL